MKGALNLYFLFEYLENSSAYVALSEIEKYLIFHAQAEDL